MHPQLVETFQDLELFAPAFFKVKDKDGLIVPFHFNSGQRYIHARLEKQLRETGRVRAVILKGRQLGCSTLIQARYFHKIITTKGKKAFILTHEADATQNLFEITHRLYDNLPKGLCPVADQASSKRLYFSSFDSGYSIGTAGNKGVGRSQTIQLLHGSEIAFWPTPEEHAKGVFQTVGRGKGTEIILESTANGIGNYFHKFWQAASGGESEYQAIFVPWFWQLEYKERIQGFKPNEEETELLELYESEGMTPEHLAWRRIKLAETSDPDAALSRFHQEYPCSVEEAFQNPIDNVFINSPCVIRARKAEVQSEAGLIIGVDPAIGDNDRTAIIRRKGRLAYNLRTYRNHNTMEVAGLVKRIIEEESPIKVYVDCIGIGAGVVDRLQEMGYSFVEGVNVARSANEKERFANLRSELWSEMRDWLNSEMPVQIPNDDNLHSELCSIGFKHRSNGQLLLEPKDALKARGMPSPDCADALMLTFYAGQYAAQDVQVQLIPEMHRSMFY
jgi:hypothetical protein